MKMDYDKEAFVSAKLLNDGNPIPTNATAISAITQMTISDLQIPRGDNFECKSPDYPGVTAIHIKVRTGAVQV